MPTLAEAIEDLLNHQELPVGEAADRHLAAGFRQRVNGGGWVDRAGFLAGIAAAREAVGHVVVTVLDELADGDRYAERHVIELVRRDGARAVQEVYVFARRDGDGRFARIEETTVAVEGR